MPAASPIRAESHGGLGTPAPDLAFPHRLVSLGFDLLVYIGNLACNNRKHAVEKAVHATQFQAVVITAAALLITPLEA